MDNIDNSEETLKPTPFQQWELSAGNLAYHGFNNGYLGENREYKLEFLHEGVNYSMQIKANPSNIIQFPKKTK